MTPRVPATRRDQATKDRIPGRVNRRTLLGGTVGGLGSVALLGRIGGERGRAAPSRAQVQGGEVVVAGIGEPKFDPYFLNSELRDVQAQIFRAPFDYRGADPYAINPALAESYEETETTLTLRLRQGVLFHNGR